MRYGVLAVVIAFVVPAPALAERVLYTPSYPRVYNVFWDKTPAFATGTPIGFVLHSFIYLTNLSSVVQGGSLQAVSGFRVTATQLGRQSWNRHVFLCGDTTFGASDSSAVSPAPTSAVSWTLPANGTAILKVGVFYTSTYCATGTACHSGLATEFAPALKLTVNEDRGAIAATLVHIYSAPVTGILLCDGTNMDNYEMSVSLPALGDITGTPLPLNGGRPF